MNNQSPDPRDRLWLDLSASRPDSPGEHAFAHHIARRIRRRRALRRAGAVAAFALGPALALLYLKINDTRPSTVAAERPAEVAPRISSAPGPVVERITDEQLFALLPDAPFLILNDENSGRKIILLADNAGPATTHIPAP
jgi:hypothetical protein